MHLQVPEGDISIPQGVLLLSQLTVLVNYMTDSESVTWLRRKGLRR